MGTLTSTRVVVTAAGTGGVEFGRTVKIGVPLVTLECTTVLPPKTLCVAMPSAEIPIASVITPELILIAKRPAVSLPSALDAMSTALGD